MSVKLYAYGDEISVIYVYIRLIYYIIFDNGKQITLSFPISKQKQQASSLALLENENRPVKREN